MVFVALPASIFSLFMLGITTHAGGFLNKLSLFFVPGAWLLNHIGEPARSLKIEYVWIILITIQILFWSVIILLFNCLRSRSD